MDWLRDLEKKIEERVEGITSGRDLHVYEAAHVLRRLLLENKLKYNGVDLLPNLFIVPFTDPAKVSLDYADELSKIIRDYFEQRPFKFLTKFTVRLAQRSKDFRDVEVGWADEWGKIALGFIECIEGPCKGDLWFIPMGGTVIGRNHKCPICIVDDALMSREHVEIKIVKRDRIVIADRGSRNGIFIGEKLRDPKKKGPFVINNGEQLKAGSSIFRIYVFPHQFARWSKKV